MRPQQNTLNPAFAQYSILGMLLLAGVFIAAIVSSGQIALGIIALLAPITVVGVVLIFYNPYIGFFFTLIIPISLLE